MVMRREMEAAEALAEMASLSMRENSGESSEKWGSKGKRVRQRVKSESPPADSSLNSVDLDPTKCSDRGEVRAGVSLQQCEEACRRVLIKQEKDEQGAELLNPSPMCPTNDSSSSGGRSRHNSTEAEKEARRLRRVLANRESARQTIRRRQALCEELNRKAAHLAWENENLKKEKELALKEFQSLESTNKHLKAQMKADVEETPEDLKSTHVEISTPPLSSCPFLLYNNHSFIPHYWPSIIQSSNPTQSHMPQNAIIVPSNVPIQATDKPDSLHKQENLINLNGSGTPLYIPSCPWFLPQPDLGNGLHHQPSFGLKNNQNETSVSNCSSPSNTDAHVENHHSSLPVKIKTEGCSTEASPSNDFNDISFGFPPDGGGQHTEPRPKEMILMPAPSSSVGSAFIVNHENGVQSDHIRNVQATVSGSNNIVKVMPEKNLTPVICSTKKGVDVVAAAAEARRRRKELTKLKNLHGHQYRMHS